MILDLFAGPGGWDVGLALLGLEALGIEVDEVCCVTRSQAGLSTQRADVARLDPTHFSDVEGLIASPPCQDWSVAGTLTKNEGKTGWLVDEPARWVEALRPRWVAQEQVPGAIPVWEEQARRYHDLGYHVWTGLLSSEQYGVPQTRSRAFLMAHLDHPVSPPAPTHQRYVHGQRAQEQVGLFETLRPWVSMAEALGWGMDARPSVTVMGTTNGSDGGPRALDGGAHARAVLRDAQSDGAWVPKRVGFPRRDDGRPNGGDEDGLRVRDWRDADEPAFVVTEKARSWVVEALHDPHLHMKGSNLRPTARAIDQPAQALAFGHNSTGWQWDDGPARPWPHSRPATTVCGDPRLTAPQHHYHGDQGRSPVDSADVQAGEDPGVRPIRIEPWEAAVLQSFPADYPFAGARTRQFGQIGDAVPPFMAAAVIGTLVGANWQDAIARLLYPEEF